MTTHRRYPNDVAAWRLLLAYQRRDELAKQVIIHQLAGCAHCWDYVALYLTNRILQADLPDSEPVSWVESRLLAMLDDLALDDAA